MEVNATKQSLVISLYNALADSDVSMYHMYMDTERVKPFYDELVERFQKNRLVCWQEIKKMKKKDILDILYLLKWWAEDAHPDYPESFPWVEVHVSAWRGHKNNIPAIFREKRVNIPFAGSFYIPLETEVASWNGKEWAF